MSRYAVTGAGGFVGRNLVHHLVSNGHDVVAIVRDASQAGFKAGPGLELHQADVRRPQEVASALTDADGVFNLAALFNHSECSWQDYRDVNVTGAVNVVAAAKAAGARRVVHCSTVGVATQAHSPPYDENTPYSPVPNDRYEVTKAEGEQAVIEAARQHGISLCVIRPTQIYGPGDRSKAKFYRLVMKGWIVDPKDTLKHPIYIGDLCRAFEIAMTQPRADGEIFLIADPAPVPLTEMVSLAARSLGVREPRRLPARPAMLAAALAEDLSKMVGVSSPVHRRSLDFFTRSIAVSTDKAREVLGFEAETPLAEGMRATIDWYRQENIL